MPWLASPSDASHRLVGLPNNLRKINFHHVIHFRLVDLEKELTFRLAAKDNLLDIVRMLSELLHEINKEQYYI